MKTFLRVIPGIGGILLLASQLSVQGKQLPLGLVARADLGRAQEEQEEPRKPANSQVILSAIRDLRRAINGKALVRNRCHSQRKDVEIQETSEVVEANKCRLVVKTIKTNRSADNATEPQSVEFLIHADLSDLTTPVLIEPQKFAQCDAGGEVLKVSSRSDPKKPIQVTRRAQPGPTANLEDTKQTRRDLGLFFADPAAAKKAANALERAVKACGGKEWPDEDDLP